MQDAVLWLFPEETQSYRLLSLMSVSTSRLLAWPLLFAIVPFSHIAGENQSRFLPLYKYTFPESTRNLATVATLNDHYLILQMFLIQQVDFDIIRHPFVCSLAHTQCSSRYSLSFLLSGTLLTSPKEHKNWNSRQVSRHRIAKKWAYTVVMCTNGLWKSHHSYAPNEGQKMSSKFVISDQYRWLQKDRFWKRKCSKNNMERARESKQSTAVGKIRKAYVSI